MRRPFFLKRTGAAELILLDTFHNLAEYDQKFWRALTVEASSTQIDGYIYSHNDVNGAAVLEHSGTLQSGLTNVDVQQEAIHTFDNDIFALFSCCNTRKKSNRKNIENSITGCDI